MELDPHGDLLEPRRFEPLAGDLLVVRGGHDAVVECHRRGRLLARHQHLADPRDAAELDSAELGQPAGLRPGVGDRLAVGFFLELVEVVEDEPDELAPLVAIPVVVVRRCSRPAADLAAGVLGHVQQLGHELEQGLLVHGADVRDADDELPRELDLDLALPRGGHVHVVRVERLPLLVDEQAPLLDRDVPHLEGGEGVLEPLLRIAVLHDRVGGQLRGGRDLQVDLQPVRLGGGDALADDGESVDVRLGIDRALGELAPGRTRGDGQGHRRGEDDRDVRPTHSTPPFSVPPCPRGRSSRPLPTCAGTPRSYDC